MRRALQPLSEGNGMPFLSVILNRFWSPLSSRHSTLVSSSAGVCAGGLVQFFPDIKPAASFSFSSDFSPFLPKTRTLSPFPLYTSLRRFLAEINSFFFPILWPIAGVPFLCSPIPFFSTGREPTPSPLSRGVPRVFFSFFVARIRRAPLFKSPGWLSATCPSFFSLIQIDTVFSFLHHGIYDVSFSFSPPAGFFSKSLRSEKRRLPLFPPPATMSPLFGLALSSLFFLSRAGRPPHHIQAQKCSISSRRRMTSSPLGSTTYFPPPPQELSPLFLPLWRSRLRGLLFPKTRAIFFSCFAPGLSFSFQFFCSVHADPFFSPSACSKTAPPIGGGTPPPPPPPLPPTQNAACFSFFSPEKLRISPACRGDPSPPSQFPLAILPPNSSQFFS